MIEPGHGVPATHRFEWRFERAGGLGAELLRVEVDTLGDTLRACRAWTICAGSEADEPCAAARPEAIAIDAGARCASLDVAAGMLHIIVPGVVLAAIDGADGRLIYARSALLGALGAHRGAREAPALQTFRADPARSGAHMPGFASAGAGF